MKKLLLSVLLVSVAFLGGRFSEEWPIARGGGKPGGGGTPLLDDRFYADTNGDGVLDLSDAVRLLSFLFSGGVAPYCVAQGVNLEERRPGNSPGWLFGNLAGNSRWLAVRGVCGATTRSLAPAFI